MSNLRCQWCSGNAGSCYCNSQGLQSMQSPSPQAIEQWKQQAGASLGIAGGIGGLQQQLNEQYKQLAQAHGLIPVPKKEKSMHKWRVTFKANGGTESRGHEAQEAMVDRDGALTFWIDSRLVAAYADGVWQAMTLETPK